MYSSSLFKPYISTCHDSLYVEISSFCTMSGIEFRCSHSCVNYRCRGNWRSLICFIPNTNIYKSVFCGRIHLHIPQWFVVTLWLQKPDVDVLHRVWLHIWGWDQGRENFIRFPATPGAYCRQASGKQCFISPHTTETLTMDRAFVVLSCPEGMNKIDRCISALKHNKTHTKCAFPISDLIHSRLFVKEGNQTTGMWLVMKCQI